MPGADSTGKEVVYEHSHRLNEGQLTILVILDGGRYSVALSADIARPLIFHWGAAFGSGHEWVLPPVSLRPPGTIIYQDAAAQTPFEDSGGSRRLTIEFDSVDAPAGIPFVLKQGDNGRWIKDNGRNFFIPVTAGFERKKRLSAGGLDHIAGIIIENEMGRNSWTLMHRFNLCFDLLDDLGSNNADGIALVYVWLRYSYIRQLDWQRNYNTKPRELGHAMGRLADKIAERYVNEPFEREYLRLIMTTLGIGKDAQRVRDEILNIMHRHHIKEVSGHFLEEWHQKLHNNATPDDIVICESFIEFLKSDGNLDLFYKKLEEGGLSRERIENYERPIRSHPDFIPYLKDALIHDFGHFLGILREVHSGTDLKASLDNASYLLDTYMRGVMDFIWGHRNDGGQGLILLLEKVLEARRWAAGHINKGQRGVRDLLFLDLALEDFFRIAVERNLQAEWDEQGLSVLTVMSLENLCLSSRDEEFEKCLAFWRRLINSGQWGKLKALQAKSVNDRLERGLGNFIDSYSKALQPWAATLGKAFHAADWVVGLFTEEVVRGRPVFVLSQLLRRLDPLLRKKAELGNWQVISPGSGGVNAAVEIADHLISVQGKSFSSSTVLVTDRVEGNEEIPAGVTALLTSSSVDALSHLAVRARNAHVLFAVCYDHGVLEKIKSDKGHWIRLTVGPSGDIIRENAAEMEARDKPAVTVGSRSTFAGYSPVFSAYALPMEDFSESNTGGKSNNLKRMLGKLTGWISLPHSAALPFGVFEKVLALPANREFSDRHGALLDKINEQKEEAIHDILEDIKGVILSLEAPEELFASLCDAMKKAGLQQPAEWPEKWQDSWMCIKRVWASKWNERAYFSRKANGIQHKDLSMAVLIQNVVEAEYSFVVHTVNPFTNEKDEIYAEVAAGLGEALVANYPGRALGFTFGKGEDGTRLVSLPSKSSGLFGGGLAFRSDSNGEDLTGYAGAGLYDSFMLPQPVKATLDYTEDKLIWDDGFRNEVLTKIGEIGLAVERVFGIPQDIEGAYSKGRYYVVQSRPQTGLENA